MKARDDERSGGRDVHDRQGTDAADTISKRAANRSYERTREHGSGSEIAGGDGAQTVVGVEVDSER
jgi:hypothetical protein